ncbi:MAG TPA: hypothetical protein VMQ65_04900 [Candidatus Limnocylindria bacterium]|nr:hypothetical protein [Candidatus Limnocylindria bacterium]
MDDATVAPQPEAAAPEPLTLLYLDVDDEITSAAARIRLAGADRVALVLPYGSRLATSRINFRLLAREATERGKKIEIICADPSARALALAAGLPVHPSVAAFEGRVPAGAGGWADGSGDDAPGTGTDPDRGAAGAPKAGAIAGLAAAVRGARSREPADDTQTRVLPVPRRSPTKVPIVGPPRPPVRTGVAVGVGVAALVLVLVGGLLAVELLPSATIVLHPRSEDIGPLQLSVQARPDANAPDAEAQVIPAQHIAFELEASDTFPTTGVKTVETKATGNVRFSNWDTGSSNRIDAGAIVSTDSGIEFVTLATVTLPNATIEFPFTIVPSTSTVGVEAVAAGPEGNVGNNSIVVVPKGENRRLLQVTNVEATAGGARTDLPVVSADDVEAATAAIEAALVAELDQQVAARTGVPEEVTLFAETRAVGAAEYATDPGSLVGTEGAEFDLLATAEGSALGVDPTPLEAIAESRLRARVGDGWTLLPESITALVGDPLAVGDVVTYPVTIAGTQVHDVDQAALIQAIRGLVLAEARSRLDDFGDAEITLWPDWVTNVPTRPDRITFTLAEPQPSASPAP